MRATRWQTSRGLVLGGAAMLAERPRTGFRRLPRRAGVTYDLSAALALTDGIAVTNRTMVAQPGAPCEASEPRAYFTIGR
jgi:hypothetical protein